MTPQLMRSKRVFLRVTPIIRDIKDPEIDEMMDNSDEERASNYYDQ